MADCVGFVGVAGSVAARISTRSRTTSAVSMSADVPKSRRAFLADLALVSAVALPSAAFAEGTPPALAGQLESFSDTQKGFKMLKPSGWNEFGASESFDVKFVDLINPLEVITVVTTPVTKGKTVKDIGTAEEIGAKLAKSRSMQVVDTKMKEKDGIYTAIVELKSDKLRQLTVLTINKSKLYTVNLACPENRWSRRDKMMRAIAESFQPRL